MTTSPDFSVADVLAWARTKPAGEVYNYVDPTNCALCQFLRETGRATEPNVNPFTWRDGVKATKRFSLPNGLDAALSEDTFGALATRLEALIPEPRSVWTHQVAYLSDRVRIMANA
jgi:hypothetical protein